MSDNERRTQIGIRLNPRPLAEIDKIAAEQEWTRSQVLRQLLRLGLVEWRAGKR